MPEMNSLEKARAEAMLSVKKEENLERLLDYAIPEVGVALYSMRPAGVGPATIIQGYLVSKGRDVCPHTYNPGDRFNKRDVKGRRVLAVKESAFTNGIRQIGEAAQEAIERGYIGEDDFRLLLADTFKLLTPDEILASYESRTVSENQSLERD